MAMAIIESYGYDYGSERYRIVWYIGYLYYTVVWDSIKTIPFDFYGII